MTENKKKPSASSSRVALTALALIPLLASSSFAAEDYFRSYAPFLPPLSLPGPILGDETRISAARPAAAGPAYADFSANADAPQGRLRLRPAHFGGM